MRNGISSLLALLLLSACQSKLIVAELSESRQVDVFAFGSCLSQDQGAPIWDTILANRPQLFLAMGDNVYASSPLQKPISAQYRKLNARQEYRRAREQIPFLATWDDHDFGVRDGGGDWGGKESSRQDFLDYWSYLRAKLPANQLGIYHSVLLGPPSHSVQILMLDTRYFRTPLKERPGKEGQGMDYLPQDGGTILGEEQWKWLSQELRKPAKVRFLVTSVQLIAEEPRFEKWGNFPKERERFFHLLKATGVRNLVLLSGDRHIASISQIKLADYGKLTEVTSSSLNRANSYEDKDPHYLGPVYNKENFGLARIDWLKNKLTLEIRNLQNQVINSIVLDLSEEPLGK
jgi:alkaline phosphatase D